MSRCGVTTDVAPVRIARSYEAAPRGAGDPERVPRAEAGRFWAPAGGGAAATAAYESGCGRPVVLGGPLARPSDAGPCGAERAGLSQRDAPGGAGGGLGTSIRGLCAGGRPQAGGGAPGGWMGPRAFAPPPPPWEAGPEPPLTLAGAVAASGAAAAGGAAPLAALAVWASGLALSRRPSAAAYDIGGEEGGAVPARDSGLPSARDAGRLAGAVAGAGERERVGEGAVRRAKTAGAGASRCGCGLGARCGGCCGALGPGERRNTAAGEMTVGEAGRGWSSGLFGDDIQTGGSKRSDPETLSDAGGRHKANKIASRRGPHRIRLSK